MENSINPLILPLAKSHWPKNRIGPKRWQNCYRIEKEALKIARKFQNSKILLLTEVVPKDSEMSELQYMEKTLLGLGASPTLLDVRSEGYDTYSIIMRAISIAQEEKRELIIISNLEYSIRVRWVAYRARSKSVSVSHVVVVGIPRPAEFFSDIILTFIYPIIDFFGHAESFSQWVRKRRKKGHL